MSKINEWLQGVHDSRSEEPRPETVGISDFHALFPATPGLYVVLKPDLTIVDASDEYLRATLIRREEIRGCGIFDIFPDNPGDPAADGVKNLRASLHQVLQRGTPHRMAIQRYDVRDHVLGDGDWIERFWTSENSPVFGSGSREITHVILQVEDVTQALFLRQWIEEQSLVIAEQHSTLEQMREELMDRQRELGAAHKPLAAMIHAGGPLDRSLEEIQMQLGAPETRRHLGPGSPIPVSGIYNAFHQRACELVPSRVFMQAGRAFPRCPRCQDGVLYRLMRPDL